MMTEGMTVRKLNQIINLYAEEKYYLLQSFLINVFLILQGNCPFDEFGLPNSSRRFCFDVRVREGRKFETYKGSRYLNRYQQQNVPIRTSLRV